MWKAKGKELRAKSKEQTEQCESRILGMSAASSLKPAGLKQRLRGKR
jgi:hypothetical protein